MEILLLLVEITYYNASIKRSSTISPLGKIIKSVDGGRSLGRVPGGSRYSWVEGVPDPTKKGPGEQWFRVYHWMSPDIKVRRSSLPGLPPLPSQPNFVDFGFNLGDYVDTSDVETADISGTNRIFIMVHNRGLAAIPGNQVRVLLLLCDASAGLPQLPNDYASHINAVDTSWNWLVGTLWHFADEAMPYRVLTGDLDPRIPQVVEYSADLSALSLPTGHKHVCAAAFVTTLTSSDQITSTNPSLDYVTMHDKHLSHRNVHLVDAEARPMPQEPSRYEHSPQTFLIYFHNANKKDSHINIVFERDNFFGHLSLILPKVSDKEGQERFNGWKSAEPNQLEDKIIVKHLKDWFKRIDDQTDKDKTLSVENKLKLQKFSELDRTAIYVADNIQSPTITNLPILSNDFITAAVTVMASADSKPGDQFRFDIIQKEDERIIGGSSYVLVVTKNVSHNEHVR